MKLRIFENSIRLRLSQADAARLSNEGFLEAALWFNTHSALRYRLLLGSAPAASFDGKTVVISIPSADAREWLSSDREGMGVMAGPLKVSVEKDYECLHRENGEDSFPNPLKKQ